MRKIILLIVLLSNILLLHAQSSLQHSYFRLLNFQGSNTDIRVLSKFSSADDVPPPLLGYSNEIHSDTLYFKILYKERLSTGSGSAVYRDDTFRNVSLPVGINYLTILGSTMKEGSNGQPNDTFWNETDSTFILHPVSINDISKNSPTIRVYPNPANHALSFEKGLDYEQVLVYNSIGQQVAVYQKNSARSIDIATLSKGMYVIKLYGKKAELIGRARFVKTE